MVRSTKFAFLILFAAAAVFGCRSNDNSSTPQTVLPYGGNCPTGVNCNYGGGYGYGNTIHFQGYIGTSALNASIARDILGTTYNYIGGCYGSGCWYASTIDIYGQAQSPNGIVWRVQLTFSPYNGLPQQVYGTGSYYPTNNSTGSEIDTVLAGPYGGIGTYKIQVQSPSALLDGSNPGPISVSILANGQLLSPSSLVRVP